MLRAWVCAWVLCAGLKGWLPHFTFGWMMVLLRCAACSTCSRNGVMKRNVLWILFLANLFRRQPGREMKTSHFRLERKTFQVFLKDWRWSRCWLRHVFPIGAEPSENHVQTGHHRCQSIHAVFAHGIRLTLHNEDEKFFFFGEKDQCWIEMDLDSRRLFARSRALTRIAINNDRKFYRFSCWAEC